MTVEFWVGGLVGMALGLFGDFLARPLHRALDRQVESRANKQSDALKQAVATDRAAYRDWLVLQLLEIALVTAVTGAIGGVFFVSAVLAGAASMGNFFDAPEQEIAAFGAVLSGLGQVFILFGAYLVLRIAGRAISTAKLMISLPKLPQPAKAAGA